LSYRIIYTKKANRDAKLIKNSPLCQKIKDILNILRENPFQIPPEYEKLTGKYNRAYSRRINVQHRLIYEVIESEKIVKILRMWKHYE